HNGESDGFIASKEFGMIVDCDTEDAIEEGAAKIYNLITGADTEEANTAGIPLFNRFAKADSMKVVPPPFSRDYTSLSDHIDLDESQMSYGTKSSTSSDSNDSSVKSSEPKPNDSTFYASTSNISTSENEAEIESNLGTPIQEPIIVQDLPSFSCNSSDKNENTSRTSCNKNGYFNKKACHFRKNASFVSKLCFVYGSGTHIIKDCNFYEKQMVNKTVGIGVGPVHSRNIVNHQNQFVPQVVLLRTGKVNIPPARPQPVPTGKPKVFAPVPTGSQNMPFPVPTDRGYSPSDIFESNSYSASKRILEKVVKQDGTSQPFSPSDSLVFGTRFSTQDFMNSSDSIAGIVSRCSSPILRESMGSLGNFRF
nr:hypothetical protein [Tanacetum cinerariifolium]